MKKALAGAAIAAALCTSLVACADQEDPKPAPTSTAPRPTPTTPSPKPTPTRPSPTSTPTPTPSPTSEDATPTEAAALPTKAEAEEPPEPVEPEVYYSNCSEVRAAGAAPIRRGQPGYSSKLDRDGDGIACDN